MRTYREHRLRLHGSPATSLNPKIGELGDHNQIYAYCSRCRHSGPLDLAALRERYSPQLSLGAYGLGCAARGAAPALSRKGTSGMRDRTVGRREGDRLLYAGKVRSGYTEAVARDLRERLDPFIRKSSPLSEPVKKPKATWVEPVLEAEVAYSTVTKNQLLREAVFKGLRAAREVAPARRT
jgi:hypothetical protein